MKILCVADEVDNLVYSNNIADRFKDVDLIIGAGDLRTRYYEYIITALNKKCYFVYGNHHTEDIFLYDKSVKAPSNMSNREKELMMCGAEYVDGKVVYDKRHKLIIAGLGGCMKYNDGGHQYTERQMRKRINRMVPRLIWNRIVHGRYLDILITHAPALGLGDDVDKCHIGFSSFLTFMDRFKPKYMIHGHVHLWDPNIEKRTLLYKQTRIINAYMSYVIDDPALGRK